MRVAVCDDNPKELEQIRLLLEQYDKLHKMQNESIQLTCYAKAKELIADLKDGASYQLFFLDIVMPEVDGIELGQLIRKSNAEVPVIYTTSSTEYALKAFANKALRYLVKPIQKAEFAEAMDYVYKYLYRREKTPFSINTREGIITISIEDVLYVENESRVMVFHLKDNRQVHSTSIRSSFEENIHKILEQPFFIQPHKSFAVNMQYVKSYTTALMIMDDDQSIPISRSKANEVKKAYLRYLTQMDK